MNTNTQTIELERLRDVNATMLAALQSVDRRIEALVGEQRWYECGNEPAKLCREVRAAIAKATGAMAGKTIAPPTPQQPTAESTAYELPCSL